jgi:ribose transport system permease protein
LLLLVAFNAAFTPNFLSVDAIRVNLTQVATVVIVGTGMTLVIATGGIDLSVGSLMAIAGALAPMIFLGTIWPIPDARLAVGLAFVVPVLVAAGCGWFNGVLITRFRLQPIVATLVLFLAGRGIAQVLTGGKFQLFDNPAFQAIGRGRLFGVPTQVVLMVVVAGVAAWIVRRTTFGAYLLATGGNPAAARLAGVPVTAVTRAVYAISGLLAGVAGLIYVAVNSSSDANQVGQLMELDAIAAVAVGGTPLTGGQANVGGTVVGALIIQVLRTTLVSHGVPDAAARVAIAGAILVAVLLQLPRRS